MCWFSFSCHQLCLINYKRSYFVGLMERIIFLIGGVVIFIGLIFSFFNAVTSNPAAFAIIFLIGGAVIGFYFIHGKGDWHPKSENYPPYKNILIILGACLIISWVIGARPTTLDYCPTSLGRWC